MSLVTPVSQLKKLKKKKKMILVHSHKTKRRGMFRGKDGVERKAKQMFFLFCFNKIYKKRNG
jgi:hypothetical protein